MPIFTPFRSRSPKMESLERERLGRLLSLSILEYFTSPLAAVNRFVSKKDHGTTVTTNVWAPNNPKVPDLFPMEIVGNTLDWLSPKKLFSTFDLKDCFHQVELDNDSRPFYCSPHCTGTSAVNETTTTVENFFQHLPRRREHDFGMAERDGRTIIWGRYKCRHRNRDETLKMVGWGPRVTLWQRCAPETVKVLPWSKDCGSPGTQSK